MPVTIPYGAASVGYALGLMAHQRRFLRPTCVFVDGDQQKREGCAILPGDDAPERVVFGQLLKVGWKDLDTQVARSYSEVADACTNAMTYMSHREWIKLAADRLLLGGDILWHAMCVCWVKSCLSEDQAEQVIRPIADALSTA